MSYDSDLLALGPSAHWKLEDTDSDGDADGTDSTANGRNLTVVAGSTIVAGPFTGSTGAMHGLASIARAAWMNTSVALTVIGWIKSGTGGNRIAIAGESDSVTASFNNNWQLYLSGSTDSPAGAFRATTWQANGVQNGAAVSAAGFQDNSWHMVALVWVPGTLKLYVDGALVSTVAAAAALGGFGWNLTVGSLNGNQPMTANAGSGLGRVTPLYGVALTGAQIAALYTASSLTAPGVPTSVQVPVPYITTTEAEIEWAAPASGGAVDNYVVRLDGDAGTEVTVTPGFFGYNWTGLTPDTDYELSVAAENAAGRSAFVPVDFHTLVPPPPPPPGWYRATLTLGQVLAWDITTADAPAYGPKLPVSLGWDVPDAVDYFPAQPNPTIMAFDVLLSSAADLRADPLVPGDDPYTVEPGEPVTFALYLDDDPDAEPWQSFSGIVTQLDGRAMPKDGDGHQDFLVTVYAADDTMRLDRILVGYTTDWPEESIEDRVARVATEAGLDLLSLGGTGQEGILAGKLATRPVTALAALRDALSAAGSDNTSEPPDEFYGRFLYALDASTTPHTLRIEPWERRLFPSSLITLDGCLVEAAVAWTMIPQRDRRATWAIVDGWTFGTPDDTTPIVMSTNLVDLTPTNPSSTTRDNLGESLLPDGSTQLTGWYSRALRYHAATAPDPVEGLCSFPYGPVRQCYSVQITPLTEDLQVNGEDYLAGTLTGARLVLAPGGELYVDLRLRPELLPGWDA